MSTLLGHAAFIKRCEVVLASQSPRRLDIMRLMQLEPRIVVSTFVEDLDKSAFAQPVDYAVENALQKAKEVAKRLIPARAQAARGSTDATPPLIVIGSDTIVDLAGEILEKPRDDQDAFDMLRKLSGRRHTVHSGVAIFTSAGGAEAPAAAVSATTEVAFADLSDAEIREYIGTGEPMDKSGAYGIQGIGGQFVTGIKGCSFNVAGLPMNLLSQTLAKIIAEGKV